MYVISATHSRLGRSAVKLRSTRSGAWRAPSRTVVMVLLRRLTPTKPAFRISRATRLRPTRMPASARSICRRGAPYVPFEATCAAWILAVNAASVTARIEGGRFTHA